MPWRQEKTETGNDLVWDGVEKGIGPSPTRGTANIQNANISTESGEVMASFARAEESQRVIAAGTSGATLTASVSDGATLLAGPVAPASPLFAGTWIRILSSTISSITAATNPSSATVNYLVVAGGGGGGAAFSGGSGGGGGGGAGGLLASSTSASVGSYVITVGTGGVGGNAASTAGSGTDSIYTGVVTATGGGGGARGTSPVGNATNGGSGGGGSGETAGPGTGTAGTGTGGQGNNGGTGRQAANASGGGGGGASAVGANAPSSGVGGAGGAGTASSISGVSTTYAGGGGGGGISSGGAGGAGGGGAGTTNNVTGTAGTANTGGGGGGASDNDANSSSGGVGGTGIVILSYVTGAMYATGGIVTYSGGNTIHTFKSSGLFKVININSGGLYYVSYKDTNNKIKLSAAFDPTGAHVTTHGTSGTATFETVAIPNSMIAKATEPYSTASSGNEFRYYIMDVNGNVWVYDTAVYDSSLAASGVATKWMMPDPNNYSTLKFGGMAVLNGWLMVVSNANIYGKPTINLGTNFTPLPNGALNNPFPTHGNFAFVGQQGKMYYCDDGYIGELFPTTSLVTSIANIQSYASYTASTYTGTVASLIGGSNPYSGGTRIPVVFYTDIYGTMPTAVSANTVYYIQLTPSLGTFEAYDALTSGNRIDIGTGASGTQYFNTFYPLGFDASIDGTNSTVQFSPQRVNLPFYETAQCMVEVGNIVIIGGASSTLHPWNQIDATPSDAIALPEANVKTMVNVNNMAYVFAGNKGNIYVTNTSVASLALKVPDYVAGIAGTPLTYIEPYFTWGDSDYLRGRVYFSILDQTATKAGNAGGIWSFVPPQNMYDTEAGVSLRLENERENSTLNGYATIILPNQEQLAVSPQYWAGWQNSYSVASSVEFTIDNTGTVPVTQYLVETDLLPTGSFLTKQTFQQIEYKLTTPMVVGDSVAMYWRVNSTDAWQQVTGVEEESTNRLSGFFNVDFQKTQWIQFKVVATTTGLTTSSFVRLKQIRLR